MKIDNSGMNDQIILRNLASIEEQGEEGFTAYSAGQKEAGRHLLESSIKESHANIRSIQDPELKEQTEKLFSMANRAIREYLRNPSDTNMDIVRTHVLTYKKFLSLHQ